MVAEEVLTVSELSVMKCGEALLLLLSGYVVVCQFQSGQCDRQFHFVTQSKTWTEAQLYCREKYTDLATFTSKDKTMAAQQLAGSQKFWIGLFRVWKWSYTGTGKSTFTNWGPGEPGVEKCVTVSALGIWSTRDCSEEKHFICYSDDAGRYILVQDSRSFYGAQSYCRDRYTDLSSINSVVNNTEIMTLLASDIYDSYSMNGSRWLIPSLSLAWIGLSNSWEWSDGSDIQFLPLTLQSADGDCMMVDQSSSSWLFQPCNNTYPFLCYQDVQTPVLKRSVKVWLRAGSADLNDPAVQESILQQSCSRAPPNCSLLHLQNKKPEDHLVVFSSSLHVLSQQKKILDDNCVSMNSRI
ncbi:prolactin regulatory element-binding protein [Sarotherodon galilaeus]